MPSHSIARQHDAAAVVRDRTADLRDAAATDRDTTADDRDQVADHRDHIADDRDALADERDRLAQTTPDQVGESVTEAHLQRALTARDAAAADRHHAWSDRAAWAQDRARAAGDRTRAEDDRDNAEHDRAAASGDRGTAAQHRQSTDLDPLTGALHRGAGRAALLQEMTRATREHHPLVVAYIDVDQMKAVNDTGGHQAGDQLLRHVVAALRAAFRPHDLIVRQGGDEFLCILPGMRTAAAKIRMKHVNTDLAATDRPGSVTAGFAQMHPGDTDEQLTNRADKDLYRTKPRSQPPPP
jgi:diguanylate cyclase (GGDEF)-like protein